MSSTLRVRIVRGLVLPRTRYAIGAAAIYWLSAVWTHRTATPETAYFNQLADAFLHGRLHLENPAAQHDLTAHNGKWYVPFPPLTALVMMPAVLVLGLRHVNTVMFAAIVGGANVWMLDALLTALDQRGVAPVSARTRRWLCLCWTLGTVAFYVSTQGTVWFLAHGTAAFFLLAALSAAVHGRAVAAGVLLGVAALGRPTTILMAPALIGLLLHGQSSPRPGRLNRKLRRAEPAVQTSAPGATFAPRTPPDGPSRSNVSQLIARIVGPAGAIAALLLVYNTARFGRPTEFGYQGENIDPSLADNLTAYGQFSLHFVKHNLWAMFAAGPTWAADRNTWVPDPQGMSVLLTTPALLYVCRARLAEHLNRWLWVAVVLVTVPLLTYYNTGWYQFGYRFSMDVLPLLFVLLAIGLRDRLTRGAQVLIAIGVVVNFWGMAWFNGR